MVMGVGCLGGCEAVAFTCEEDASCNGGRCEANGHCSFADDDCDSGRRYGDHAGDSSQECVDAASAARQTEGTTQEDLEPKDTTGTGADPISEGGSSSSSSGPEEDSSSSSSSGGGEPEVCDGIDNDGDGLVDEWSEANPEDNCNGCNLAQWRGRSYYYCTDGPLISGWESARAHCLGLGADLVSVHSLAENQFLASFAPNAGWIGLNDREEEQTFVWSDGHPYDPGEASPWGYMGDTAGIEDCVYIHEDGKWYDIDCLSVRRIICASEWVPGVG
jgi:hypothetical protein